MENAPQEGSQEVTEPIEGQQQEPAKEEGNPDAGVVDSHGQPGINLERHNREMKQRDERIAELEAKLDAQAKTEQGREELQKQIQELKDSMESERIDHKLELLGCRNAKAAKALLGDYDNDAEKLKEAAPYLFEDKKPTGTTGAQPQGATNGDESAKRLAAGRKAAGLI